MAQVVFKEIAKRYGDVSVIEGLNLEIHDHEFMVLVGPSGCGKSTALRMIAGLEEISDGTIAIGDRVVNDLAPKDRDIAMVFQSYALYPHMTIRENLEFGLKIRKTPQGRDGQARGRGGRDARHHAAPRPQAEAALRRPAPARRGRAGHRAQARRSSSSTSRSRTSTPSCASRCAPRSRKLQHRLKTTTVYVTHDQVEAMTMGHRIAVMKDGKLQQVGTPLEVYEQPANLFVAAFIGTPPMNFVKATLDGRRHDAEGRDVLPPGGAVVPRR